MENGEYQKEKVALYADAVTAQLQSIPGVQHAGLGMHLPLNGGGWQMWAKFWVAGEGNSRAGFVHGISQAVTTDYFATLGVPLRLGRNFSGADRMHTRKVAIINEEFARRKFANRNPIGRRIGIEDGRETYEIVGVIASIKSLGLQNPAPPQIYLPMAQQPVPAIIAVLRTTGEPAALSRAVQRQVLAVDPDVPAYRVRTGDQLLGRSVANGVIVSEAGVPVAPILRLPCHKPPYTSLLPCLRLSSGNRIPYKLIYYPKISRNLRTRYAKIRRTSRRTNRRLISQPPGAA